MVHAVHPNPTQVEDYLNRLLDLNYKLIMEELYQETETISLNYFDESEDCNNSNDLSNVNNSQSPNESQVQN